MQNCQEKSYLQYLTKELNIRAFLKKEIDYLSMKCTTKAIFSIDLVFLLKYFIFIFEFMRTVNSIFDSVFIAEIKFENTFPHIHFICVCIKWIEEGKNKGAEEVQVKLE
jgi:hypothetical protein